MKSVLIAIQPYYVFLIIARLMGWNIPQEKTIEVRKDFPKDPAWNKRVLIYCSKNKKSFNRIPEQYSPLMAKFLGKVIGEFVCDFIDATYPIHIPRINKTVYTDEWVKGSRATNTRLSMEEISEYGKGKPLYGWHISDLKIYDVPKELGKFGVACHKDECEECGNCPYLQSVAGSYPCEDSGEEWCGVGNIKPITRAPQSWCYIEA